MANGNAIWIATIFLFTGSVNTLAAKWANLLKGDGGDGVMRTFKHPFVQSWGMFLGESLCLIAFYAYMFLRPRLQAGEPDPDENLPDSLKPKPFNWMILLPPALLDLLATSAMYIGLTLTSASSFQMLRGSVIIFTGVFSWLILGHRLRWVRWLGIFLVFLGLVVIGLTDMFFSGKTDNPEKDNVQPLLQDKNAEMLLGDGIIVFAQILVALQMVYEEKFISKYNIPALQAVGIEGLFGFIAMSILLVPFYFIPAGSFGVEPRFVVEDSLHGFRQIGSNGYLLVAFLLLLFSIAFFNFAGITFTKLMSATGRLVMDSVRTLFVWFFSLVVGWQVFYGLHVLGFALLVTGMCVYNEVIFEPAVIFIYEKITKKSGA